MEHPWQDRLSEYVDGTLSAAERAECEAHLAQCPECTGLVFELRAVAWRAARLGAPAPVPDLWAGIAGRIGDEGGRKPGRTHVRPLPVAGRAPGQWMAAAAVAVFLAGGAVVWGVLQQKTPAVGPAPVATTVAPPTGGMTVLPAMARAEATYEQATADLRAILDEGRDQLDPKTVAVLERNLALIDTAIAETETALRNDPASAYLNSYLARTMQRKLTLLRQAATLVQARS
ncbi:MAG TPA: zf-HC2 domain-containing protein [Gemmatimonadales bacterium]|nr:zf-HC2 domain-containing protein [Gemmatimonadales bacterium]